MLTLQKIDTTSKAQVRRFVALPFRLYKNDPQWVPALRIDVEAQLDKSKYPFYEHSDADFFLAVRDGEVVGRIGAIENRPFNKYHGTHKGQFYFYESVDDQEVANLLFEALFDWARRRGLDTVIGPKSVSVMDGYGLLIDGFQYRQMMTSMNHNPPYYVSQVEALGFTKEVDFVSCYAEAQAFKFPETIHRIAERVERRGTLRVQRFNNMRELKAWVPRIGYAYNKTFIHNWEYYPLTEREVAFILSTLQTVADPKLIKIIVHGDDVVGFLFAFPDLGLAMRRSQGRLFPFGLADIMLEMRRTDWVAVNAAGILPEFQGLGGNALLYSEMERTVRQRNFVHAALYQVAETAVDMRRDLLQNLGGVATKNHRVFTRKI
jgi:GNAT superfamily N-acetyltransferase